MTLSAGFAKEEQLYGYESQDVHGARRRSRRRPVGDVPGESGESKGADKRDRRRSVDAGRGSIPKLCPPASMPTRSSGWPLASGTRSCSSGSMTTPMASRSATGGSSRSLRPGPGADFDVRIAGPLDAWRPGLRRLWSPDRRRRRRSPLALPGRPFCGSRRSCETRWGRRFRSTWATRSTGSSIRSSVATVYVRIRGIQYRVYFEEAGQGMPMVLQHTAGSDSRQWRHSAGGPRAAATVPDDRLRPAVPRAIAPADDGPLVDHRVSDGHAAPHGFDRGDFERPAARAPRLHGLLGGRLSRAGPRLLPSRQVPGGDRDQLVDCGQARRRQRQAVCESLQSSAERHRLHRGPGCT